MTVSDAIEFMFGNQHAFTRSSLRVFGAAVWLDCFWGYSVFVAHADWGLVWSDEWRT